MPTLYIIAGPNGAGKTTASKTLLPNVFATDIFINADVIAAKLNPHNVEAVAMKAARMMLEQIQNTLQERKTFAIETTMASRSYLNLVKQAQLSGYDVVLYFFYLPSAEMAKERVKLRVSQGGHHIPADVIERRYDLGIKYFFEYISIVNRLYVYKNDEKPPRLIARGEMPNIITILNESLWNKLKNK
jgi:predicted ABC-type ATPase